MERFVHLLSKRGRRQIVALLYSKRSMREVATALGVTTASVSKYMSGTTHPSDDTVIRGLEALEEEEIEEAAKIIFEDLYAGMEEFLEWAVSNSSLSQEIVDKLIMLGEKYRKLVTKRSRVVIR